MKPAWLLALGALLVAVGGGWIVYRSNAGRLSHSSGPEPLTLTGERANVRLFKNPGRAPAFSVRDLDGRTISVPERPGKVTIVNFWATWCGPCRAEIPSLVALQEHYRDQLQIIGISEDEGSPEAVRQFAAARRVNYPVAMTTPEMERLFPGVTALPTSFVIDPDGRIMQKHVGLLDAETAELETRVLAGLPVNASIEQVEDANRTLIEHAAQATEIPGIDLKKLTPEKRTAALQRLNTDPCTCGCGLTLAACRINDPSCGVSLPLARKVVDELKN